MIMRINNDNIKLQLFYSMVYISICNRGYLTQPIQGSNKPQCFLVTAIIKLFWYPIYVERTVRNVNSINKIVIQCREHSRKVLEYYNACFCTSVKIASCFGIFLHCRINTTCICINCQ